MTVKVEDYKLDFTHALASYIRAKQFSTNNAKPWVQWADQHFKRVRRLFCRLEQVYGIMSSNHILNQNNPLAEMPELNDEKMNAQTRHISRKPVSQNHRPNSQMGNSSMA